MAGIVAIVGRPNVGKSTFFNRMVGARDAIVDDVSGVTRDRHYGTSEWNGVEFTVIDTGGYVESTDDVFEIEIKKQVLLALEEADVVLFMVDVRTGLTAEDQDFARIIRGVNKPVFIAANKVDNHDQAYQAAEFYKFGFDKLFTVSSITGSGNGDLLDEIVEELKNVETQVEKIDETLPKFCVIGKPNVGKSTFVNALLGVERNIVADIPGTTRDSIYTLYNKYGKSFYLIDTAGLRKKKVVHEDIEFYSVMRAIRALEESDVAFIMLDANEGLTSQDLNIIGLALKRKKGMVILMNKWDLSEKETNTIKELTEQLKKKMAPFTDVPILFTSAKEKTRIFKALEKGMQVAESRQQKLSTSKLNEWLEQTIAKYPIPSYGGRAVKIKYMTQLPTPTPVFAFFCNMPSYVIDSYKRYLENQLRASFNFEGVPIKLVFKKK
ncbi:MAG: ribosome biogenesis GTPase Der [Bacteroidetes bacterium]|nr:ribosome biogenesis GTPase Der [Bacteroidota bacterium]